MTAVVPPPRTLGLVWLSAAVAFGGLLAVARAAEGPLDDTDPALQRPGFLDAGSLPDRAVAVTAGVPATDRPSVVFFTRPERLDRLCHALAGHRLGDAAVAIVVSATRARCGSVPTAVAIVADGDGSIADAYGVREPRGGGPPVGYAVVDTDGLIRYRTLDPTVHDELTEVGTVLDALE